MPVTYGKDTPKLGFGLMRLPKRGVVIDVEKVKTMVDLFLDAGFTYFDTAFVYPGSETATRKALVERHPRDSFTLATKLNAMVAPTEKAARKQFAVSLEHTGAGYFDYYLLHALMENNYKRYEKLHLWDFVNEQKEAGLIRNLGFSFHAGPQLLDQLLTEHPEVDFVQLQINYADWENPKVTSRANYEVARKHGKLITVMEPVKGGSLADPPADVKKLFKNIHPDMSCASWATFTIFCPYWTEMIASTVIFPSAKWTLIPFCTVLRPMSSASSFPAVLASPETPSVSLMAFTTSEAITSSDIFMLPFSCEIVTYFSAIAHSSPYT